MEVGLMYTPVHTYLCPFLISSHFAGIRIFHPFIPLCSYSQYNMHIVLIEEREWTKMGAITYECDRVHAGSAATIEFGMNE